MKIVVDTSYLLPLIGLTHTNVQEDFLLNLLENTETLQIFYSTISIFELQAKGAKEAVNGNLDEHIVIQGIQTLCNEDDLVEIPFINSTFITQLSIDLRKHHKDFIDCLILSTAILNVNILVTENKWMTNFVKSDKYNEVASKYDLSSEFKVLSSTDFLNLNL